MRARRFIGGGLLGYGVRGQCDRVNRGDLPGFEVAGLPAGVSRGTCVDRGVEVDGEGTVRDLAFVHLLHGIRSERAQPGAHRRRARGGRFRGSFHEQSVAACHQKQPIFTLRHRGCESAFRRGLHERKIGQNLHVRGGQARGIRGIRIELTCAVEGGHEHGMGGVGALLKELIELGFQVLKLLRIQHRSGARSGCDRRGYGCGAALRLSAAWV